MVALRSLNAEYEVVLFLAFRSLGGPATSSHGSGFLVDYHFKYSMGHVRGNFDLKKMTARVGSGPLSLSHVRDKALHVDARADWFF